MGYKGLRILTWTGLRDVSIVEKNGRICEFDQLISRFTRQLHCNWTENYYEALLYSTILVCVDPLLSTLLWCWPLWFILPWCGGVLVVPIVSCSAPGGRAQGHLDGHQAQARVGGWGGGGNGGHCGGSGGGEASIIPGGLGRPTPCPRGSQS